MSDDINTSQETTTPNSIYPTDSGTPSMPSEAPKAPTDTVTPPSVKDDNLSQDSLDGQIIEPVQTAQMDPEPEQAQTPETTPETGTAQSAGSEPLSKPAEPIASELTPVSAPAPVSITPQPKNIIRELFAKAQQAIQFRKRKKLDHVMTLFAKRTNITNDQVGELLHVSDATATRYLELLEKENKIKQVGKTGKGVSYIKI